MKGGAPGRPRASAFTLVELLASMGASVIIIGGLMMSAIGTQRVISGSERFAEAYSSQRRLIDYLARDLRRSIDVAQADSSGLVLALGDAPLVLEEGRCLVVTIPGYYRSGVKESAGFYDALDVVATAERLDYGTTGKGLAAPVEVRYRKQGLGFGRGVGFVRIEEGVEEVVVDAASELTLQVQFSPVKRVGRVQASYRSTFSSTAPIVTSYDVLLSRNPPLDFRP